jgi:hypothetical protein
VGGLDEEAPGVGDGVGLAGTFHASGVALDSLVAGRGGARHLFHHLSAIQTVSRRPKQGFSSAGVHLVRLRGPLEAGDHSQSHDRYELSNKCHSTY